MESEGGKVTKEIESEGEKVTKGSEPELQKTAAAGENEKVPDRMIPEVKSENAKEEPFSFKNVQPMSTKSEGKDSKSNETATFTFGGHQFQISHQKFQISPQWPKGKSGDESKQDEEDEDEDPSANEDGEHAHDPWFEPIIQLPLIEIQTCEEGFRIFKFSFLVFGFLNFKSPVSNSFIPNSSIPNFLFQILGF